MSRGDLTEVEWRILKVLLPVEREAGKRGRGCRPRTLVQKADVGVNARLGGRCPSRVGHDRSARMELGAACATADGSAVCQ